MYAQSPMAHRLTWEVQHSRVGETHNFWSELNPPGARTSLLALYLAKPAKLHSHSRIKNLIVYCITGKTVRCVAVNVPRAVKGCLSLVQNLTPLYI